jgi:hypothetical protein
MPFARSYSLVERALHHLAFSTPVVQKMLGELENDLYRKRLTAAGSSREVFVTGLPRAGTTLVLELLYGTGEFRTFTYRDMPFILAPLLWQRFSQGSRLKGTQVERAHGDGVQVSYDSPEAFEEVAWLNLLGKQILRDHTLAPVPPEAVTTEAQEGLRLLVRKVVLASSGPGGAAPRRYLSKNNANISRLGALARLFPTARVLIVFRDPLAQVASLMAQHRRFLAEHAEDRFSERYMRWIGHFEFGSDFRPIDFEGHFGGSALEREPDAGFWLGYWTAAYRHALRAQSPQVRWVDFDALVAQPKSGLEQLGRAAEVRDRERLLSAASTLRAPTSRPMRPGDVPAGALHAAQEVHAALRSAAAGEGRDGQDRPACRTARRSAAYST